MNYLRYLAATLALASLAGCLATAPAHRSAKAATPAKNQVITSDRNGQILIDGKPLPSSRGSSSGGNSGGGCYRSPTNPGRGNAQC